MLLIEIYKLKILYQNGEFSNAGKIDEDFYKKYDKNICTTIDECINNNELKKGLELYDNLTNYVLSSNGIDYDINSELCARYEQAKSFLSSELNDKYLETEYKYMVEQSKNNSYDERTTYNLITMIFNDEKYKDDKSTQYNILTNKFETLKRKENDCRVSELNILKELYNNLGDYEKSREFVTEINNALKWQGAWVLQSEMKYGTVNTDVAPEQLAISYFGGNIYDDYIFNGAYRYKGVYKFEKINDNTLSISKKSGDTWFSNGTISAEDDKLILSVELLGKIELTFIRETEDNNYIDKANKVLSENLTTEKTMPKVGMTANQVRTSTWGIPDEINKDTYSWGTTEQWVYRDLGYVYLENGIVTSVSIR